MLNGAPNRRGRLSLKTWLLHSNTPKQWCKYSLVLQQIKQSTINYIHTRIYNIVICASLRHRSKRASLPRIQNTQCIHMMMTNTGAGCQKSPIGPIIAGRLIKKEKQTYTCKSANMSVMLRKSS